MPDFTDMAAKNLKIAILSGKGGTGKTLLSVNLASAAADSVYVDCDVEEPNGHLFFKPQWNIEKEISVKIPQVDPNKCDGCKKCVEFCVQRSIHHQNFYECLPLLRRVFAGMSTGGPTERRSRRNSFCWRSKEYGASSE